MENDPRQETAQCLELVCLGLGRIRQRKRTVQQQDRLEADGIGNENELVVLKQERKCDSGLGSIGLSDDYLDGRGLLASLVRAVSFLRYEVRTCLIQKKLGTLPVGDGGLDRRLEGGCLAHFYPLSAASLNMKHWLRVDIVTSTVVGESHLHFKGFGDSALAAAVVTTVAVAPNYRASKPHVP